MSDIEKVTFWAELGSFNTPNAEKLWNLDFFCLLGGGGSGALDQIGGPPKVLQKKKVLPWANRKFALDEEGQSYLPAEEKLAKWP